MISIDVFEYCNNCPYFEADVDKSNVDGFFGETITTVVRCANRDKCELIAKYLLKKVKRNG